MRVTLNVNNPDIDEQDLRLITLDVYPEMTIETLRSSIAAEGIPVPSQHIYHNGQLITDDSQTLQALQIGDGDMLALHVRDMSGSSAPGRRQQPPQQQQAQRRPGGGGGGAPAASGSVVQDPEMIRLQILGDPQLRARVQSMNAPLAAALNDPERFAQALRDTAGQEEAQRRQRMQEIESLNNDEFNPEAQARIAEIIRQENVMQNLQNAMDHNPELLGRVHMLYLNVKVNGVQVKALVDSGAQATIMSPDCAERCNIMHLVDKRFAGIARGVGTANIIGRVHYTMLQVGTKYLPAAFTVMEGKQVDLLLGLDILKGHQAILDLSQNKLIIQGEGISFLGESDIPKETEEAINQEPTVSGPGGTTIGARSGAVIAPGSGSSSGSSAPVAPVQGQQPSPSASSQPARNPAQQSQARSAFPESDIQTLIGLGANRQTAIQALEAAEGNVELAAGLLYDA